MSNLYRNDLLAPFLALPQGDKIQAECKFVSLTSGYVLTSREQTFGSTAMVVFVQRLRLVLVITAR
jgi:hypothetical protein